MKRLFALTFVLSIAACGPVYQLAATKTVPSKPVGCDFQVAASLPEGYEEIGLVTRTVTAGGAMQPDTFKKWIADDVCKAGGDLVVTQINGEGYIVRGVVFRKVSQ